MNLQFFLFFIPIVGLWVDLFGVEWLNYFCLIDIGCIRPFIDRVTTLHVIVYNSISSQYDEVFTIIGPINFSWVLSFDGIKANR